MPGLKENFHGILEDELSGLFADCSDEITITATTDGFEMPTIALAATTNFADLKRINLDNKVTQLTDGLNKLESASKKLKEGTGLLSESLLSYNSKMVEFKSGYTAFDDGIVQAVVAAEQLKNGTAQLQAAATTLSRQVTEELIPGILGAAPLQLQLNKKMTALQAQLNGLQIPDLSSMQNQLLTAINSVCDTSSDVTIQILTNGKTFHDLSAEQQAAIITTKDKIKSQAATQIAEMMAGLDMSDLQALGQSLSEIDTLSAKLMDSMNAFTHSLYDPNDDPSNPKTLANAIIALSIGATNVDNGTNAVKNGLASLKSSSGNAKEAVHSFQSAASTLSQKSGALDAAMSQFNDDGIGQFCRSDLVTQLNTALSIKDEMQKQADTFAPYSGAPNNAVTSLRFIMKTAEIKTDDTEAAIAEAPEKHQSFWHAIADFFKRLFA